MLHKLGPLALFLHPVLDGCVIYLLLVLLGLSVQILSPKDLVKFRGRLSLLRMGSYLLAVHALIYPTHNWWVCIITRWGSGATGASRFRPRLHVVVLSLSWLPLSRPTDVSLLYLLHAWVHCWRYVRVTHVESAMILILPALVHLSLLLNFLLD